MLNLDTPVQYVKGVGPKLAEVLLTKGISTVEDLLYYLPFRYEDRLNPRRIGELRAGEMASIIAEVRTSMLFRTRRAPLFELTVGDPVRPEPSPERAVAVGPGPAQKRIFAAAARSTIKCIWFHGTYLKDRFQPGQLIALYGKVEQNQYGRGGLQLINPQFEILNGVGAGPEDAAEHSLEIGRIVPVYESAGSGKVTSRWFRRVIHRALEDLTPDVIDAIPAAIRRRISLMPRRDAFWQAHWPPEDARLPDLQVARTPAQIRLIFEELFFLELGLELKRRRLRALPGIVFHIDDRVRAAVKRILPFHPTAAQKKVLKEIADDMRAPVPMRRLLQGDVGSGKTLVAALAALQAIENGWQAALMAPTEILAEQHYLKLSHWLEPLGVRVAWVAGSLKPRAKKLALAALASGETQLAIGTHALFQEDVAFAKLGLAIVDEQHRFGVEQRLALGTRGAGAGATEPHQLMMSATPIPRTLSMSYFADLDVTVIDELPPGRTPVVTKLVSEERRDEVIERVRASCKEGAQAYWVCPLIEESEQLQLQTAIETYETIKATFPDLAVGLVHGRLKAAEKAQVMSDFKAKRIQLLVATTVIEVGVDVPNATLMVIEHAERMGLAQLHQLRGRVGRGAQQSLAILLYYQPLSEAARARLKIIYENQDGFEIARQDLLLRGPGEFLGARQSGAPLLRFADLERDADLLAAARKLADELLAARSPAVARHLDRWLGTRQFYLKA